MSSFLNGGAVPVTCWDGWRWHRASGAAHTGRGQHSDPVSPTTALGHDLLPLPAAPARYPQRQVWVRYQEEIFPQEGGEELEVPLPCGGDPRPGCMGLGAGTRWVLSSLPTSPIPQRCDGDKGGSQQAGTPSISSPNHRWRAGLGWERAASSFPSQAPTKASSPEASRQGRLRTGCLEEAAPFATARSAAAELFATPAAHRTRAAQARGVDALQLLESHSSLLHVL